MPFSTINAGTYPRCIYLSKSNKTGHREGTPKATPSKDYKYGVWVAMLKGSVVAQMVEQMSLNH